VLDTSLRFSPARVAALQARLAALPRTMLEVLRLEIKGGLNQAGRWMVENKLTGGTTADRLARRSGQLIRAVNTEVVIEGAGTLEPGVRGKLYIREKQPVGNRTPAHVYAPVHEFGATIRPRPERGPNAVLAIPMTEEARRRGSPTKFQGFWQQDTRGRLWFFRERPGEEMLDVLFRGVKEVRIPPRPYMRPTAERFFPEIVARIMRRTRGLVSVSAAGPQQG